MQLKDATYIIRSINEMRARSLSDTGIAGAEQIDRHLSSMRGGVRKVLRIIEQAPVIDAAPVVHGRWIWHEDKWEHECSNCHCGFDYDKTYLLFDHGYEYASYCPNCGAKMDGRVEA